MSKKRLDFELESISYPHFEYREIHLFYLKNFFVKRVFIVNLKQKICIDKKLFELIIFLVSCQMFLEGDVKL